MHLPDYHVHTRLCGHAVGTPEEYIEAAIGRGLGEIGFSDHAPLPEPLRDGITMLPEMTENYIAHIEQCRETYRSAISVKVAFEVDFPLHDTFDRRFLVDPRLDYLIGSCHILDTWPLDHPDYISEFDKRDIDEIYTQYFSLLDRMVESGNFNFIGHFDLVKKFGHRPRRSFLDDIARLADNIAAAGMAVEINTSGLRKPVREFYPSEDILSLLCDHRVPITLGSDSHAPQEVGYEFGMAIEMARRVGYRSIAGFSRRKRYDIGI